MKSRVARAVFIIAAAGIIAGMPTASTAQKADSAVGNVTSHHTIENQEPRVHEPSNHERALDLKGSKAKKLGGAKTYLCATKSCGHGSGSSDGENEIGNKY